MINPMRRKFLCLFLPLLGFLRVEGAVVVTYRGDSPNTFDYLPFPSDVDFDVNSDGLADYRFLSDGSFVALIQSYGSNRFISTLSTGKDVGGDVAPVESGSIIGIDSSMLSGGWHHHTDNVGNPALSTGYGLNSGAMQMQFADAYIGVEFAAADGIHYGWIQYVGYSHPEKGLGHYLPGGSIDSWAWETRPGVPITAGAIPEPSATLLFLVASLAMLCRNRKE